MKKISSIRREYGSHELREEDMSPNPFLQFENWLQEALQHDTLDATAMVLATVDKKGAPDTRVVLLKEFGQRGFIFFTHYDSPKAIQVEKNHVVALNFYWNQLARQVRIKGNIAKISRQESESYFLSRPRESQINTLASNQSAVITKGDLEKRIKKIAEQYQGKPIPCPENWGGYCIQPVEFEFFQGRNYRLNDRVRYLKQSEQWKMERLSP